MPLMPVVFAVQNLAAAQKLNAIISYAVKPLGGGLNETVNGQQQWLKNAQANNETITFSSSGMSRVVSSAGTWEFMWSLRWQNCSVSEDPAYYNQTYPWVDAADGLNIDEVHKGFHLSGYNVHAGSIIFTTRDGASQPNLTAVDCDKTPSFAFPPVVDLLHVDTHLAYREHIETCAQITNSTSVSRSNASPCQVSISPEAESSILAKITDAECN
ncbi:hypothetical protein BJY04DRAFT_215561 [Aspergillus karnatakaensis]|uniref:uncharacterized protein n=1 Tax=Aspergillus karnatakaensis TaxID=1810916 RepID=UPI003CCDA348